MTRKLKPLQRGAEITHALLSGERVTVESICEDYGVKPRQARNIGRALGSLWFLTWNDYELRLSVDCFIP